MYPSAMFYYPSLKINTFHTSKLYNNVNFTNYTKSCFLPYFTWKFALNIHFMFLPYKIEDIEHSDIIVLVIWNFL